LPPGKPNKVDYVSCTAFADVIPVSLVLAKIKEKLLSEEDIQCVLRRLSRLTQEEAQMVVIQNMEVIYGLIRNIRVVMDGERSSAG
jgi:hypothetical protein